MSEARKAFILWLRFLPCQAHWQVTAAAVSHAQRTCDPLRVTGRCLGFSFGARQAFLTNGGRQCLDQRNYHIYTDMRELFADENNATVSPTTAISRIACDRVGFAIAFGRKAATVNAVVAKPIHDGLGTII